MTVTKRFVSLFLLIIVKNRTGARFVIISQPNKIELFHIFRVKFRIKLLLSVLTEPSNR